MRALAIIRSEHLSLATVLQGMLFLIEQTEQRGAAPDFDLFSAMIAYIDEFAERFHHPKEDAYLFRALRIRHGVSGTLLDQLQSEHAIGALKIRRLERAMLRYRECGDRELPAFAAAVKDYVQFHRRHMRSEEKEILPAARAWLKPDDWKAIDAAFTDHKDPLFGVKAADEYRILFQRIVSVVPSMSGIGAKTAHVATASEAAPADVQP